MADISKITDVLGNIYNVKDSNGRTLLQNFKDNAILMQNAQPSALDNKLWIAEGTSYQIPTMDDLEETIVNWLLNNLDFELNIETGELQVTYKDT